MENMAYNKKMRAVFWP